MKKLKDISQRIIAINLPYKPERRAALTRNLGETGLARPDDITWTKAISGDWCPPPSWWGAGNGAWGCLMSHVRAVQDAIMDGVETLCLLEDDVVFHPKAGEMLERLLRELPDNWDQVYLGGQHLKEPEVIPGKSFVWRARNINRTHAYILRRKVFGRFLQHVLNAPDYLENRGFHIDHQLGTAHERRTWNTYVPAWWLCGQEAGASNISGRENPRKWWQPRRYSTGLPFIIVPHDISPADLNAAKPHLHPGWNLVGNTYQDIGLNACVNNPDKLRKWLLMIAHEAIDLYKLPAIQHPDITQADIENAWPAGARTLEEVELQQLCGYPFNGLFSHPLSLLATAQGAAWNVTDNPLTSDKVEHDANGNMLLLPHGSDGDWGKAMKLTWDAWNRLVKVQSASAGTEIASYQYDGLWRRTTKKITGEVRHYYYNDQWRSIEEHIEKADFSHIVEQQHFWGAHHRWEYHRRDRDANTADSNSALSQTHYTLQDAMSITAVVDTTGTIKERYQYSAFGQRLCVSADGTGLTESAFAWMLGFHVEFSDAGGGGLVDTGLTNYGFRYYDSLCGRWLGREPYGESASLNLYEAVGNTPSIWIDYLRLHIAKNGLRYEGHHWLLALRKKIGPPIGQSEVDKLCKGFININRFTTDIEYHAHDFVHDSSRFNYTGHYRALRDACKGLRGDPKGRSPCCCLLSGVKKLLIATMRALGYQRMRGLVPKEFIEPDYFPMHSYWDPKPPGINTGPEFDKKLKQACSTCSTEDGSKVGETAVEASLATVSSAYYLSALQEQFLPLATQQTPAPGYSPAPGKIPVPAPAPAPISPGLTPIPAH